MRAKDVGWGTLTCKAMIEELELMKDNGSGEKAEKQEDQDGNQGSSVPQN